MSTDISERETQEYLKRLTVLYVEDEEDSRDLCSEFLSRLVGVLVTAQNGAEGLVAWRQHKPDIIITDIRMPVMDGLAMLQEIRSIDREVPVIVLSAFEETEYLKRSIALGVSNYVSKPVDPVHFTEALLICARTLLVDYKLHQARVFSENIVGSLREPLLVLNSSLKIIKANSSFYEMFKVTPEETIGNFIYDLGNRQWNIPKLRLLLEEILPQNSVFYDYEVEHDFQGIGRKTIVLNARQIFREDIGSQIILLAMEDITEHKQMEAELRESESRFRTMANSAPVLIWIAGTNKLCTWFNQIWLDFTGRSIEQEYGNGWAEGVHPDDLEHCLDTYVTAFDSRQPFSMEFRLRAADGQYRWVIDNGVPTYAEHAFTGFIGSCVDITGQKTVEKELFETTALLANITNSNPDAIYSKDLDGRYMMFNNAAARFIGKSADEVLGKNDYNLFPPYVAKKLMENDRKIVKEGSFVTFEETITNVSGLERSFLVTKGPLINQEGEVFGVFGVSRNITERKQTERELAVLRELSLQMAEKRTEEIRKSESFTNDIIDSMISHIAVLDATGKIIKINKPWKRFAEENCGHNFISDFVGSNYLSACSTSIESDGDQDAAAACDGINSVLQRKTEHFWMEYPCHSPAEQRWFLMTVSRLYDGHGVVVSHTNITERKKAEEREKETNHKLTRHMAKLELANEQLKKMQRALQKSEKTLSGCS